MDIYSGRCTWKSVTRGERTRSLFIAVLLNPATRERLLWRMTIEEICSLASTCKMLRKLCATYIAKLKENVLPESIAAYAQDLLLWNKLAYVPDTNILHYAIQPVLRDHMSVARCSNGYIYTFEYVSILLDVWVEYVNQYGRLGLCSREPLHAYTAYRNWKHGKRLRHLLSFVPDTAKWSVGNVTPNDRCSILPLEDAHHSYMKDAYTAYLVDMNTKDPFLSEHLRVIKMHAEKIKTRIADGRMKPPPLIRVEEEDVSTCALQ